MRIYVIPDENETKFQSFKRKAKEKFDNGIDAIKQHNAIKQHKEEIIEIAPLALGALAVTAKVITKSVHLKQERDLKDRFVWDNRLGHYWKTRRKLSNSEWLEVERRKKLGEDIGTILRSMKLLR